MGDDEELEKLREERSKELQEQGSQDQESAEEAREQQKESIWNQAKQHMTSEAISRLGNVKAANEELALSVAQQVTRLGASGQIGKVDEDQMKKILRSLQSEKEKNESDIKFRR